MPSFKQAPYGGSPTTQRKRPNIDPLFGKKKKKPEGKKMNRAVVRGAMTMTFNLIDCFKRRQKQFFTPFKNIWPFNISL